jgi:PST family polysaccharide transporter
LLNLRERALRGGAFLVLREGAGIVIGFLGFVLLTRLIGPSNYGLYAGSMAIISLATTASTLGVDAFIIRHEDEPSDAMYHQAFALLAATSIPVALVGALLTPVVVGRILGPDVIKPLQLLFLTIPVTQLQFPCRARLERELRYQPLAVVELTGQLAYYALALPLAWWGLGVWAPVAGQFAVQLVTVVALYRVARYIPRLIWSWSMLRAMLGYSVSYSSTVWVSSSRHLVNPIVVGGLVGPEGVGLVALATRLIYLLIFVQRATARLSIAALARVREDTHRLRRAVNEAMLLQVLAVGFPLAGVGLLVRPVFPTLFGSEWRAAIDLYPYLALAALVNAVFNMQQATLYTFKRNWSMTLFFACFVLLLAIGSVPLVAWFGVVGYGLAALLQLPANAILHVTASRHVAVSYRAVLPWVLAFTPPVMAPLVPLPWSVVLAIPLVMMLVWPGSRRQIAGYLQYFRQRASTSVR